MNPDDRAGMRGAVSALMRSYFSDVRRWAAGLSTRYIVAVAVALGGILAIFAACAVGITALFNLIESRYGADAAYAAIGGGLFFIGMILLLLAWIMFKGRIPPLPRPHRQVRSARRMMVQSSALRGIASLGEKSLGEAKVAPSGPAIPALIATGATLLVGWIVGSHVATIRRERRRRADSAQ
jgi:hypothetical protein